MRNRDQEKTADEAVERTSKGIVAQVKGNIKEEENSTAEKSSLKAKNQPIKDDSDSRR